MLCFGIAVDCYINRHSSLFEHNKKTEDNIMTNGLTTRTKDITKGLRGWSPVDDLINEFLTPFRTHNTPRPNQTYQVIDNDDHFEYRVDVPGANREDIELTVRDNVLRVKTERSDVNETATTTSMKHTSYSYGLKLSDEIDQDSIEAELQNGVLSVTLPKIQQDEEEPESRSIEIK
jgi:HSP20 family protein